MKKVIAAVLAASTALSLASVSVFAADAEYEATAVATGASGTANFRLLTDNNTNGSELYKDPIEPDNSVYIRLSGLSKGDFGAPVAGTAIAYGGGSALGDLFGDSDLFKAKFDKGDNNAKMISKMSLVHEKDEGNNYSSANGRAWWIKIELKDDYTKEEYKMTPSITFTAKKDLDDAGKVVSTGVTLPAGTKFTIDATIFMSNTENKADVDYAAGKGGVVVKPSKNDDNEITWEDESNTIASLNFFSDDDAAKFFPKLSTKWDNAEYAEYFANQNAFIFSFVGNPTISSTSRATLALYNPYTNEDGDETVDPENITIYQVDADGNYIDVTDQFTYMANDNDDMVFATKTRTLGTYIMCETAPETADDEITDDIIDAGDITVEGDKDLPITGNF